MSVMAMQKNVIFMKKNKLRLAIGLLSSSMLVACGGGDSGPTVTDDDSVSAGGVVFITALDGYYKNALLFLDGDNDGQLDLDGTDTIFGLTDENGQRSIPEGTTGTLAVQTLLPGGTIQQQLIAYSDEFSDMYAGTYTIDMDFPNQAVADELVIQAYSTSRIISPITDLVSIQMRVNGLTEEEAQNAVTTALGLNDGTDLYIDFVADAVTNSSSAKLHKIAQILAASKSANSTDDYNTYALQIARAATARADSIAADDAANGTSYLTDNTVSAVIIVDTSTAEGTITISNNAAVSSRSVLTALQSELDQLDIVQGQNALSYISTQSLDSLITDTDQSGAVALSIQNAGADGTFSTGGITFSITADNKLSLAASNVTATQDIQLVLVAEDLNSEGNYVSNVYVDVILNVNQTPTVDNTIQTSLETSVQSWLITENQPFTQSVDIAGLFVDPEGSSLTYTVEATITGLSAVISGTTLTVSGTPTIASENGQLFISATDGSASESVLFDLPTVVEEVVTILDTDGDSYVDTDDAFPNDPAEWLDTDSDGIGNNADTDDDGDGVIDEYDSAPLDSSAGVTTAAVAAQTLFSESGFYSLWTDEDDIGNVNLFLNTLTISGNQAVMTSLEQATDSGWVAATEENRDLMLTDSGWADVDQNGHTLSYSNGAFTVYPTNYTSAVFSVELTYQNLSGQLMTSGLPIWQYYEDTSVVFSSGAHQFIMTDLTPQSDYYWLSPGWEAYIYAGNAGIGDGSVATLDEIIVSASAGDGVSRGAIKALYLSSDLAVEFVSGGVANYYQIVDTTANIISTSTWDRPSSYSADLIEFTIPQVVLTAMSDGDEYSILSVYNGVVYRGFIDKAGTVSNETLYYYNTLAIEDISNNLDFAENTVPYAISTGIVTFTDEASIPADAMVRITPNTYTAVDNYEVGVRCDIADDGSFGSDCMTSEDNVASLDIVFADSNETYQVVVFRNNINTDEYKWDCGEDAYKYVGGSESSWASIEVTSSDYEDRSGEVCTGN